MLAFKTLRIRDFVWATIALLILASPYLLLESRRHFLNFQQFIQLAKTPGIFNTESLKIYAILVRSTVHKFAFNASQGIDTHIFDANDHSIMSTTPLKYLHTFFGMENILMPLLVICAALICIVALLWPGKHTRYADGVKLIWKDFQASPERKGLLLLLVWQDLVFVMLKHPGPLFVHYLLFLSAWSFYPAGYCPDYSSEACQILSAILGEAHTL